MAYDKLYFETLNLIMASSVVQVNEMFQALTLTCKSEYESTKRIENCIWNGAIKDMQNLYLKNGSRRSRKRLLNYKQVANECYDPLIVRSTFN